MSGAAMKLVTGPSKTFGVRSSPQALAQNAALLHDARCFFLNETFKEDVCLRS